MSSVFGLILRWNCVKLLRSRRPEVFCKKDVVRNFEKFTEKHLCQSLFFNKFATYNFIKKEALAQVFSCEFYEISRTPFLTEHLRWLLLNCWEVENYYFQLIHLITPRFDYSLSIKPVMKRFRLDHCFYWTLARTDV